MLKEHFESGKIIRKKLAGNIALCHQPGNGNTGSNRLFWNYICLV